MNGSSTLLSLSRSILLMARITGRSGGSSLSTASSSRAEVLGLDHQHDRIDAGEAVGDGPVHRLVQRAAVGGLEAGRVDEHELRIGRGDDAGHAMARGLGLARGDADLLSDQPVEQRGLADVRAADDRHEAGAMRVRSCARDACS